MTDASTQFTRKRSILRAPLFSSLLFNEIPVESSRTRYFRDWHRPNRSAAAKSFYFYRRHRFARWEKPRVAAYRGNCSGEEHARQISRQCTSRRVLEIPNSPAISARSHDHYAYKRSMQIRLSNRGRKATRSTYTAWFIACACLFSWRYNAYNNIENMYMYIYTSQDDEL